MSTTLVPTELETGPYLLSGLGVAERAFSERFPDFDPGGGFAELRRVEYGRLDAEGHVWAADALGARAGRIAPGGEIVDEIRPPAGMGIFACALGGPDGHTLLLCSAPDFAEDARKAAREAVLFTTTVEVGA